MKNIILIIIDALRKGNLNLYGYPIETAPFLERIGMAGRVFKNAYSTTNATDPSLTSIYTGKYPRHAGLVNHGVRIKPHEIHSLNYSIFLQEILLAYGYVTIAIDTLHRWHRRGFKYYIDPTQVHIKGGKSILKKIIHRSIKLENLWLKIVPFLSSKRGLSSKPTAKHVTELALYMLKRQANYKKPFFLLIHYWDTHTPYIPPQTIVDRLYENNKKFYVKIKPSLSEVIEKIHNNSWKKYILTLFRTHDYNLARVLAAYDASILYIDFHLKLLFKELETLGLIDNTLIIITADHGESLYEHSIFFDHHGLYDVSLAVPLIIIDREMQGKFIETPTQLIDLFPTIIDLAGLKPTQYIKRALSNVDGISLVRDSFYETSEDRLLFFEESYTERKIALRVGPLKYITALSRRDAVCRYCGRIHGGIEELYDLRADPLEVINLAEKKPELKALLRHELFKILKRLEKRKMRSKLSKYRLKMLNALRKREHIN